MMPRPVSSILGEQKSAIQSLKLLPSIPEESFYEAAGFAIDTFARETPSPDSASQRLTAPDSPQSVVSEPCSIEEHAAMGNFAYVTLLTRREI